ncbi:hypothetical protein Tco_0956436, partial [Tanacetum coccineum]
GPVDQVMEEADSNVESMPNDEILSISRDDDEGDDSDRELSVIDEVAADHVIDEILTEVNKEDIHTIVSTTPPKEVSYVSVSQSAPVSSLGDVQALIAKALWEKKNIHRNCLPQALTKAVKETFPRFNRRIKNAIKDDMPNVLNTSVLKPMYKEFNVLNKLETQRFVILEKKIHKSFNKSVQKNVKRKMGEVIGILRQCVTHQMQLIQYMEQMLHSSVKLPRDILVVNSKHLQTKVDRTLANLYELVGWVSRVMNLMDTSAPSANAAVEEENESQSQIEKTTNDIHITEFPTPAQEEP